MQLDKAAIINNYEEERNDEMQTKSYVFPENVHDFNKYN
jgi:hypothetical protein